MPLLTTFQSLETAALIIAFAPGFACKHGSTAHDREYLERRKAYADLEAAAKSYLEETETLLQTRNEPLALACEYRRQKYIQAAVRVMVCDLPNHSLSLNMGR